MSYERFALTRPCAACPFRSDIPAYLSRARVHALERDLVDRTFSCHKTVAYRRRRKDAPATEVHCAGALILLEKVDRPSGPMRVAERLGLYDRSKLDMAASVYASFDALRKAQPR